MKKLLMIIILTSCSTNPSKEINTPMNMNEPVEKVICLFEGKQEFEEQFLTLKGKDSNFFYLKTQDNKILRLDQSECLLEISMTIDMMPPFVEKSVFCDLGNVTFKHANLAIVNDEKNYVRMTSDRKTYYIPRKNCRQYSLDKLKKQ